MKAIFGLFFIIALAVMFSKSDTSPTPPKPELTEAQKQKKAEEDRIFKAHVMFVRKLKANMKNPDSFKFEEAVKMPDNSLCVSYRATNSFNAIVPGQAVITMTDYATSDDQTGKFRKLWSKTCSGKQGVSASHIKYAL